MSDVAPHTTFFPTLNAAMAAWNKIKRADPEWVYEIHVSKSHVDAYYIAVFDEEGNALGTL